MLRKLCENKGVEIIKAEASKDRIYMLVSIPLKYSVSQIMGYLQREKQPDDFRKIRKHEVQVRK